MRCERLNGNTLRRYISGRGSVIVTRSDKGRCAILPAWCNHIAATITRQAAADLLRQWRAEGRS